MLPAKTRTGPLLGEGTALLAPRDGSEQRRRELLFWLLPLVLTGAFLGVGASTVGWDRLGYHWPASLAAVLASFIAGSTPDGGNAVFLPVLTAILQSNAALARSFGMYIQSIGMGVASARILYVRVPVDWWVITLALPPAIVTEVVFLLIRGHGTPDSVAFLPSLIPGEYVQATFLILLTSTAFISVMMLYTAGSAVDAINGWNVRRTLTLVVAASVGGVLSAASASGANLMIYLFTVACFDLSPKVAIPTTVLCTTALSLVGALIIGTYGRQLDVNLNASLHLVESVGGVPLVPPAPESSDDLPGLLLAAAPIVVWGAPLGAEVARHVPEAYLVGLVLVVVVASIVSIFALVEPLHSATPALAYTLTGMGLSPPLISLLRAHRKSLFGSAPAPAPPMAPADDHLPQGLPITKPAPP